MEGMGTEHLLPPTLKLLTVRIETCLTSAVCGKTRRSQVGYTKVLMRELQSLGLDIAVHKVEQNKTEHQQM